MKRSGLTPDHAKSESSVPEDGLDGGCGGEICSQCDQMTHDSAV